MKNMIFILLTFSLLTINEIKAANRTVVYSTGFENSEGFDKKYTIGNTMYTNNWTLSENCRITSNKTHFITEGQSLMFTAIDTKTPITAILKQPFYGVTNISFNYKKNSDSQFYLDFSQDSLFNRCTSYKLLESDYTNNVKLAFYDFPFENKRYYIRLRAEFKNYDKNFRIIIDDLEISTQSIRSTFKKSEISKFGYYYDFMNELNIISLNDTLSIENEIVNYSSSDNSVADVNEKGIVRIKNPGTTTITAHVSVPPNHLDTTSYTINAVDFKSNILEPDYESKLKFNPNDSEGRIFSGKNYTNYTTHLIPTEGNTAVLILESNTITSNVIDTEELYNPTLSLDLGIYIKTGAYGSGLKTSDGINFSISYDGGIEWKECFVLSGNGNAPSWNFGEGIEFCYSYKENNKPIAGTKYSKISITDMESSDKFMFRITTKVESAQTVVAFDNIKLYADTTNNKGATRENTITLAKYLDKGICDVSYITDAGSYFINETSFINDTLTAIYNSLELGEDLILKSNYRTDPGLPEISQLYLNNASALDDENLYNSNHVYDNRLIITGRLNKEQLNHINSYIENHSNIELIDIRTALIDDNKLSLNSNTTSVRIADIRLTDKSAFNSFDSNTLLYMPSIDDTSDEIFNQSNIIIGDKMKRLELIHNKPFYPFRSFFAKEITYSRSFKPATPNGSGWETIALPFDVKSVRGVIGDENNGETEIVPFADGQMSGANFWVREFNGADNNSLFFNDTDSILKNTPYIIAMPGISFGKEHILSDRTITFMGSDQVIDNIYKCDNTQGSLNFICCYNNQEAYSYPYPLNSTGSLFTLDYNHKPDPFTPFFTLLDVAGVPKRVLTINNQVKQSLNQIRENRHYMYNTDNKTIICNHSNETLYIYDISGRLIRSMDRNCMELDLPKGYYYVQTIKK